MPGAASRCADRSGRCPRRFGLRGAAAGPAHPPCWPPGHRWCPAPPAGLVVALRPSDPAQATPPSGSPLPSPQPKGQPATASDPVRLAPAGIGLAPWRRQSRHGAAALVRDRGEPRARPATTLGPRQVGQPRDRAEAQQNDLPPEVRLQRHSTVCPPNEAPPLGPPQLPAPKPGARDLTPTHSAGLRSLGDDHRGEG